MKRDRSPGEIGNIPQGYSSELWYTDMVGRDRFGRMSFKIRIYSSDNAVEYWEYYPSGLQSDYWTGTLTQFSAELERIKRNRTKRS
jgi:hypothetical protein